MTEEEKSLIEKWQSKVQRAQKAQYSAANRAHRRHHWLGFPAVVLSSVTGAFVFADLSKMPKGIALTVGGFSLVVSILVGLQTFMRLPDGIVRHLEAAKAFGSLKRRAEQALVNTPDDAAAWIENFRRDWDEASAESPLAPSLLFSRDSR